MFGRPMSVRVNDSLTVKLAPFAREDVNYFIKDGGLQLHSVTRYIGSIHTALTQQDEEEWFDNHRTQKDSLTWGIWVNEAGVERLIGSSGLNNLEEFPMRQMTSGSMIVNKDYWGKGIATAAHKARTWYAFKQYGLTRIKSAVALPNIGSKIALSRSGYFTHSIERNTGFVDGKYVHQENLECLNPDEREWLRWWGDDDPTEVARAARPVTIEVLAWADANVTLL